MNKPNPIVITNNETNKTYTLEFNRVSVKLAEQNGLDIAKVTSEPMSVISKLFHWAFYMHHPKQLNLAQTDEILFEQLGGMSGEMLDRLCELYAYTLETLYQDEERAKNSMWAVTL